MVPPWLLLVLKRWAMQRRVISGLLLLLVLLVLLVLAPLMATVVPLTEVLVWQC